ncbi:hypothetical protein PV327_011181 [Microctonus hyperodae]|uniref:Uncharacterized protein n=1 Tax=Microctonus hyperodae TaxID=165561 RepID=A0AA39KS29_MICHY|nr:hypothetical protein PV327_011181 [Microctonus hyperodae]
MEFTPDIIGDLSPEEIRFLKFIPPLTINYDAVVHKTFSFRPGNDVFQFRYDLLNFHDSVTRLAGVRNQEMNENCGENCAKCECRKKSNKTMINKTAHILFVAHTLIMRLQCMNDELQELSKQKMRKAMKKTAAAEISQDITIVAAPNIIEEKKSEDITTPNAADEKSEDMTTPNAADEKSEDISTTASNTYDNDESHDEGYDIAGNGSPTSMKREKKSTNNDPEAFTIVTVASDDKNDEVLPHYTDEFDSMIRKAKDIWKEATEIYKFVLCK